MGDGFGIVNRDEVFINDNIPGTGLGIGLELIEVARMDRGFNRGNGEFSKEFDGGERLAQCLVGIGIEPEGAPFMTLATALTRS